MFSADAIPGFLLAALLLPLVGFIVEIFAPKWQRDTRDTRPAKFAVGCIVAAFLLSVLAFVAWGVDSEWAALQLGTEGEHPDLPVYSGLIYTLGHFGDLTIGLEYYIDSLTLAMFVMVTLIAACIHIFAMGYMDDELTDDHVDHEVHTSSGGHFHRPGRYFI